MSSGGARELVVLGTSAQVPTRRRNQVGNLLLWDDDAILFDPGEGTQRQLLLAGASTGHLSAICLTHLHGDHCLGLPGVLARFVLDHRETPVDLYFPASGLEHVRRLCRAAVLDEFPGLRLVPVPPTGAVYEHRGLRLEAVPLHHAIDTVGWRLEEPARRHLRVDDLTALGVRGHDVSRLVDEGRLETATGTVAYEDVSDLRRGDRFALVMDTAPCEGAERLADGVDLLVAESTFLDVEAELAAVSRHLTARQAGRLAAAAGARRLVLTHFSARHPDEGDFAREAASHHDDVVAARDLERVRLPGPGISRGAGSWG
ncbi:MAG TPA: ribonuclease Z [Acidimicrobiales bacterium]|nr:ribonuclease Z [Acidimicrobiales bacterium]